MYSKGNVSAETRLTMQFRKENNFRDFDLSVNDNEVPSVLSICREEMKEYITVLCTHIYYICKRIIIDEKHFFTSLL